MDYYKKRIDDEEFETAMEAFGAVYIKGPKGCGKTTTAKQKAKTVIEFQDEENREDYIAIANNIPRLNKSATPSGTEK